MPPYGSSGNDDRTPLFERITTAPVVHDDERASRALVDLEHRCGAEPDLGGLGGLIAMPAVRSLLAGIFGVSPYLTSLIEHNPASLQRALTGSPEQRFADLVREIEAEAAAAASVPDIMRVLRLFKAEVALLTALSDTGGVWPVMTAAHCLSEAADAAVAAAVRFLFRQANAKGDWLVPEPEGYIVLAMGKHGAFELNYSSDIDLIVFYDTARVRLRAGLEVQPFLVRLTRDLVRLLSERTEHGYVFRTDLRLRPSPSPRTRRSTTTSPSARIGSGPPSSRRVPLPAISLPAGAWWQSLRPSSGASTSTLRPSQISTP